MTKDLLDDIVLEYESQAVEIILGSDYCCFTLTGNFIEAVEDTEQMLSGVLNLDQKIVVMNFSYIADPAANTSLKTLLEIHEEVKSKNKRLALIQFPESLKKQMLAQSGMESPALMFSNILQVVASFGDSAQDFAAELELFKTAVNTVFETQFSIKPKLCICKKLNDAEGAMSGDVIGVVPLNSKDVCGSLMMGFPTSTVEKLGERVFGKKMAITNPELLEVVGEITNMVLGQAKDGMNRRGYGISQVIPQVFVSGGKGGINVFVQRPSWYLLYQTEIGEFNLEVAFKVT